MTFGAEIWGPPLIAAGASWLSSRGKGDKETPIQKRQKKLLDMVVDSLTGNGPFADLYKMDDKAFQTSFVEPAKAMFNNQIAPQIQQQYIASGQQRGTGLDDQLLRAGVDLDALLNQHMMQFQENAKNRKQNSINSVFGVGSGEPNKTSTGQDVMSGLSGYLSSDSFANTSANFFKDNNQSNPYSSTPPPRKGFIADHSDWKLGDKRWGN